MRANMRDVTVFERDEEYSGTGKMKTDTQMISSLFFRLLPVQILLVAVGSINSLIDGAMAGHFIGPAAMAVIGLYAPAVKIVETINAVLHAIVRDQRDHGQLFPEFIQDEDRPRSICHGRRGGNGIIFPDPCAGPLTQKKSWD